MPSSSQIQQTLADISISSQACIEGAEPCSSSNTEYFVEADADAQTTSGRVRARDRELPASNDHAHVRTQLKPEASIWPCSSRVRLLVNISDGAHGTS